MATPVLYSWPSAWGLPSASPSCIQVEAYLKLGGIGVAVESCATTAKSPTGQLPALERDPDVSPSAENDHAAARACLAFAKSTGIKDLDSHLNAGQRAELLAWSTLVEHRLDTATDFSIWVERSGYLEYSKAAFAGQPFPLNHVLPWSIRRGMCQRYAHLNSDKVYSEACEVLSAVADKLRTSEGRYMFGSKPSSLDALLFGHLVFYRSSPAAAPVLKAKVTSTPALVAYLDHILTDTFGNPSLTVQSSTSSSSSGGGSSSRGTANGAAAGGGGASTSWSDAAQGVKKPPKPMEVTQAERDFRRKSWMWLIGAGAVTLGYILLSGRYIEIGQLSAALGELDGGGGEDDEVEDEEGGEAGGDEGVPGDD